MIFQATNFTRTRLLYLLENLTPEQLCFIPKGFKNNILWNLGHILITEQMLSYGLSGLDLSVDKKFVKIYGKGSLPKITVTIEEINEIKTQLIPAIKQTKKDLKNGTFKTYNPYTTSVGITLKSVEEALQFNLFHEGIHFGIILSIKKIL